MSPKKQFIWYNYLELAEKLIEDTDNNLIEAKARTAVSRAYYACYHKALKYLQDRDRFTFTYGQPYKSEHQQVISALRFHDVDLAERLATLFRNRIDADYKIYKKINTKKAEEIILQSKEVCSDIRKMYNSSS